MESGDSYKSVTEVVVPLYGLHQYCPLLLHIAPGLSVSLLRFRNCVENLRVR